MKLTIGNKNYSSWSMRPWVLMRHFDLPFEEVMLRFDSFGPQSQFKQSALKISPAGRVPVLSDGELIIWDTLAIAEYLAESFPDQAVWPRERQARARARSLCAEMHSGFGALRSHCPMNLEASLGEVGARIVAEQPQVRADLARIQAMWSECLDASGGPFLFGAFGNADAFYAPVVARLRTYALPVAAQISAYGDRVFNNAAVQAWLKDALVEHDFVPEDEPYRQPSLR